MDILNNNRIDGNLMAETLKNEIKALEQHLRELASHTDDDLITRYQIKGTPRPTGLYWRLRGLAAYIVRRLIAITPSRKVAWPVSLKQLPLDPKAKPVLIWAVGADQDTLREACTCLSERWNTLPGFAPVLITDVADFAFFSRLGWLVEYLPHLTGEGEPYEERKLKYLARLYRDAPVLPIYAGLRATRPLDLRQLLTSEG